MSARAALGCALMWLTACADFEAPARVILPDVVVATPSFATDVQPIFTARCATASCHNFATHQIDLNLAPGYSYDEIVNVQSIFRPAAKRIAPFNADGSFLVQTLFAEATRHPEIARMPLGREPLTDNQILTIINWVVQGARRN